MADQIPAHAIAGLTTPGSAAVDARAVDYAGTLDSTDVAAALNELDAEKAAAGHTHAAAGVTVQDEGADVATSVTNIDFQGPGVTATDDGSGGVVVTVLDQAPTTALVPLTTTVSGVPVLVWDADDNLVMTEVPL